MRQIYSKRLAVLIGLMLLGLVSSGFSAQIPADDDYAADEEDYNDNDSKDEQDDNAINRPSPSTLTVQHYELLPKATDTVILECKKFVTNFSNEKQLTWIKLNTDGGTNTTIAADKNVYSTNKNIKVDENLNLIIHDFGRSDEGTYYCNILPDLLSLTIHVKGVYPPKVKILSKSRTVTGGAVTFKEGENIKLECIDVSNGPPATYKWALDGGPLRRDNGYYVNDGNLTINKADSRHGGTYQCLTDNGIKPESLETVTIKIDFAPVVTADKHHISKEHKDKTVLINAGIGDTRDLKCIYKAYPRAQYITWHFTRDGQNRSVEIQNGTDGRHTIQNGAVHGHNHSNQTVLTIKTISEADLGHYTCFVKNTVATGKYTFELSTRPEAAHFVGNEIHGKHVSFNWTVHSAMPLSDVVFYYKEDKSIEWKREIPIVSEPDSNNANLWKIHHTVELTPGTWSTKIKTKNSAGFSEMSNLEKLIVNATQHSGSSSALLQQTSNSFKFVTSLLGIFLFALASQRL